MSEVLGHAFCDDDFCKLGDITCPVMFKALMRKPQPKPDASVINPLYICYGCGADTKISQCKADCEYAKKPDAEGVRSGPTVDDIRHRIKRLNECAPNHEAFKMGDLDVMYLLEHYDKLEAELAVMDTNFIRESERNAELEAERDSLKAECEALREDLKELDPNYDNIKYNDANLIRDERLKHGK